MLDNVIRSVGLEQFIQTLNEELREDQLWEVFIHSDTGMTYDEFKKAQDKATNHVKKEHRVSHKEELDNIVEQSQGILLEFKPKEVSTEC
jgi:biopolymer transport protein ExbD